jgi:glycosyltransferase involved in cell wall biosynthesis
MSLISIVVPVYNEEASLAALLDRLRALPRAPDDKYEYVFVDDGSHDESLAILKREAAANRDCRVISLSRNFGHQIAITAGLDHATGDAVVTLDADLQDPPELIADMLAKWREGNDIVYARRIRRHGESLFKRASAAIFYRLIRRLTNTDIPADTGDFRLMSRPALLAFRGMRERHRFVRGMAAWVGFRQTCVEYERQARISGATKYGLGKMLRLAADGIVSFSWAPLRLALYVGLIAAALCGAYLFTALALWVFTKTVVPGWMSLAALIVLFGSLQLIMLGLMGEYIGRILDEVKARPLYCVREMLNIASIGALAVEESSRAGAAASAPTATKASNAHGRV